MSNRLPDQKLSYIALAVGLLALIVCGSAPNSLLLSQIGKRETSVWQRNLARLQAASPKELKELKDKKARFDMLPTEQQDKLRRLHESVMQDENRDELLSVMRRYHEWLGDLEENERDQVARGSIQERLDMVQTITERQAGQYMSGEFPPGDIGAFYTWIGELLKSKRSLLVKELEDAGRSQRGRRSSEAYLFLLLFVQGPQSDPQRTEPPEWLISDDELANLTSQLASEETNTLLNEKETTREKRELVFGWMRAAIVALFYPSELSNLDASMDAELLEFYERMSPEERQRVDGLTAKNWRQQIARLYVRSKLNLYGQRNNSSQGGGRRRN